jgi:GNAT superfamily N-acetyltransferase
VITIQRITARDVLAFKSVRLRALQDAPYAFGSTYKRESEFSDAEWLARVDKWNGKSGVGFLATEGDVPCGIAGSFLDENDATRAVLVSMWTAPTHRTRGIGRLLVNAVLDWANSRGACTLLLMVTGTNEGAMRFYERLGFAKTGRSEPHSNDLQIVEHEMFRSIP